MMKQATTLLAALIWSSISSASSDIPNKIGQVELDKSIAVERLHVNGESVQPSILSKAWATAAIRGVTTLNDIVSMSNADVSVDVELHNGIVASIAIYIAGVSPSSVRKALKVRMGSAIKTVKFSDLESDCYPAQLNEWRDDSVTALFLGFDQVWTESGPNMSQILVLRSNRLYPSIVKIKEKEIESYGGDKPCYPIP